MEDARAVLAEYGGDLGTLREVAHRDPAQVGWVVPSVARLVKKLALDMLQKAVWWWLG